MSKSARSPNRLLLIAAGIFLFGILLPVIPLLLVAGLGEDVRAVAPYFFWMGFLCSMVGAAVAISSLIDVKAVGNVTFPVLGEKWPLEVQGATLVLALLIVAGGSIVFATKLHHRFDVVDELRTAQGDLVDERARTAELEEKVELLSSILSGKHLKTMNLLRLAVACGSEDYQTITRWNTVERGDDGTGIVRNFFDVKSLPLPVGNESETYGIGDTDTLKVRVKFNDGVIDGRITLAEPERLMQVCEQLLLSLQESEAAFGGSDTLAGGKVDR